MGRDQCPRKAWMNFCLMRVVVPSEQVRTFWNLFLVTELRVAPES